MAYQFQNPTEYPPEDRAAIARENLEEWERTGWPPPEDPPERPTISFWIADEIKLSRMRHAAIDLHNFGLDGLKEIRESQFCNPRHGNQWHR